MGIAQGEAGGITSGCTDKAFRGSVGIGGVTCPASPCDDPAGHVTSVLNRL